MRIIFSCGGTGGHINPAIAMAKIMQKRHPNSGILFVGGEGMENDLVPRAGFEIRSLPARRFTHKLTPSACIKNIKTLAGMHSVLRRAYKIIDEYKPNIVIGTGGYASFPIVHAAAKRGIPTAIHESNAVPGKATQSLAKRVDKIMIGFQDGVENYRYKERVVVTGTPYREEFLSAKRDDAKRALKLDTRPVVVASFGSLGARDMNNMMIDYIELLAQSGRFQLIYATGKFGIEWVPQKISERGINLTEYPFIQMQEYIYDMPNAMAAADLMITRGGASTLTEHAITAKPAIIIPSPNVTGNHQEPNARAAETRGGALVILERDCSGELLYNKSLELLKSPENLAKMRNGMQSLSIMDSNERIYQTIMDLA